MLAVRLTTVVLAALAVLGVPTSPAVAAPAPVVEGEAMRPVGGRTGVVHDAAASAGRARVLFPAAAARAAVQTATRSTALVVRLRSGGHRQAPRVVVTVDGRQVLSLAVSSPWWRAYVVPGDWPAGPRTVTVSAGRTTGTVHVDQVQFRPATTRPPAPRAPVAPPAAPASDEPSPGGDFETRVVALVNAARSAAGLSPLAVSACATPFAEQWSARMAATGSFAHRSDLSSLLSACAASSVGENIAYGHVTADQMMEMWMNSAGHRANIMNPQFTHIGVGGVVTSAGRTYGTQNFLRLR